MSAAANQLARYGVSMEEARAFITANLDNPQRILEAALNTGLTNAMLGEIAGGVSAADVVSFFQSKGLDSNSLDLVSPAASHLAQYGIDFQDAVAFVQANQGDPTLLFNISRDYGLTFEMLGELFGNLSGGEVEAYFRSHGLLEDEPEPEPEPSGGDLIPEQWAKVATVVSLNENTGDLSNASIRAKVIAQTGESAYFNAFDPLQYETEGVPSDGVLTAEELGLGHLANLPATVETVESLLYGTIIKIQQSLDMTEALQMNSFMQANATALEAGDPVAFDSYLNLMAEIWSTPAAIPLVPASMIVDSAVMTGVAFVEAATTGQAPSLFNLDLLLA